MSTHITASSRRPLPSNPGGSYGNTLTRSDVAAPEESQQITTNRFPTKQSTTITSNTNSSDLNPRRIVSSSISTDAIPQSRVSTHIRNGHNSNTSQHQNNHRNTIPSSHSHMETHVNGNQVHVPVNSHSRKGDNDYHRTDEPIASDDEDDSRGLKKNPCQSLNTRVVRVFLTFMLLGGFAAWLWYMFADTRSSSVTIVAFLPYFPHNAVDIPITEITSLVALSSWSSVVRSNNIVLYANSTVSCDALRTVDSRIQCYFVEECTHSIHHTPIMKCVLQHLIAKQLATDNVVLLSESTIIDSRFIHAVLRIHQQSPSYFASSKRILSTPSAQTIRAKQQNFVEALFKDAASRSKVQDGVAIDAMAMSVDILKKFISILPDFVTNARSWESWMLAQAILQADTVPITVIDMTLSAPVLHLRSLGQNVLSTPDGDASLRVSQEAVTYNRDLSSQSLGYKSVISSIDYMPWKTTGECSESCVLEANPNSGDIVTFARRANSDGYLAVLTVNSGYMQLAMNWVCWADRINFTNFILLAEDKAAGAQMQQRGIPTIVRANAPDMKAAADYGSVEFQETMTYRTEFLQSVLNAGFHFMTADMDAIWLSDPFVHMDLKADLSGQTHKKYKLSGGLVVVRSTPSGRDFWQRVIDCQAENAKFLATHAVGTYEPSAYTEQYCINEISLKLMPSPPEFTRSLLDPYLFPDGKFFFDEQQSQHAGVTPVIIHNNWIKGADNKLARQRDWDLHSTNEENTECLDIITYPSPALKPITSKQTFFLTIRIIAYSHPVALASLVSTLSQSVYDGDHVNLEIDIDGLESSASDDITKKHEECIEFAKSLQWPHGETSTKISTERRGHLEQWSRSWTDDEDDRKLLLILDETVSISPSFYTWVKRAVDKYYLSGENENRMAGIGLDAQDTILQETYNSRYGGRTPANVIHSLSDPSLRSIPVFRAQAFSPYATLLFPSHFRMWQQWLRDKSVDKRTALSALSLTPASTTDSSEEQLRREGQGIACVPLLVSNDWWKEAPDRNWWQWMLRFFFEKGLYTLQTHFAGCSQALVVHDYAWNAGNAGERPHPTTRVVKRNDPILEVFPPLHSVPLFDFSYTLVSPPSLLGYRTSMSPIHKSRQCFSVRMYEDEIRVRAEAEERQRQEKQRIQRAKAEAAAKKALEEKAKKAKAKESKDIAKKPLRAAK